MAALGSQSIASSYEQLLHVDRDGGGNSTTHVSIKDGDNGTTFGFTIATDALMMSSTNRLEFGDTGTYIHQSADGVLDLVSDTEIEINATTIDINGAVAMDGAMTGGTNITISGELDAATLDISGNADIDGTLEADAITVDGTALATYIRDTVGTNMLSSNTESGITVTYDTSNDNIDFAVDASQTGLTSILNASLVAGRDADNQIKFSTDDEIIFRVAGGDGVTMKASGEIEATSLDISGDIDVDGSITSSDGATITTADNTDTLALVSTDADANAGPNLVLYRNSGSPADNDTNGYVTFKGRNDNSQDVVYSAIESYVTDVSDGTEDAEFNLRTMVGGSLQPRISMHPTEVVINDGSIDSDFRVESDGNANMLVVDAGNDRVGIGTNSPDSCTLHVHSASAGTVSPNAAADELVLENSAAVGMTMLGGTSSTCTIAMGDADSNYQGVIIYDNNDSSMKFKTANNEAMRINSAGAVTKPITPAFLARPASDQTNFAEDSLVTVVLGTEVFDQAANFASNTFTAPVTGKYQLNVSIYFQDVQIEYGYYEVLLKTSNRNYNGIFDSASFDQEATYHTVQVSVLADMDASDTAHVEVKAEGTGGDASHDIGTGSYFSGYLAC